MTREQLNEIFNTDCTELDKNGKSIVKGTPKEIIDWIADKFCESDIKGATANSSSPLFSNAFTGMYDKKGKPIHEGDYVRLYYKGEYVVCQVIYDVKHAAFFIKWPDGYVNQYFMNGNSYEVVDSNKHQKN